MRYWSKWRSPSRGCIFIAALSLAIPAQAQNGDAGASDPAEPMGSEAQADPNAAAAGAGALAAEPSPQQPSPQQPSPQQPSPQQPAAQQPVPPGLKALTPSQRLPENLQGWMRERQRRNPALMERHAAAPAEPTFARPQRSDDPAVEVLKRRLQSFDEGGVTVLSNRHARTEPVAPALTRVASAAAVSPPADGTGPVAAAAPEEPFEPATDRATSVETRSLRAQPSRSATEDATPQWPIWLAVCAALGLTVLWLRRRRATA